MGEIEMIREMKFEIKNIRTEKIKLKKKIAGTKVYLLVMIEIWKRTDQEKRKENCKEKRKKSSKEKKRGIYSERKREKLNVRKKEKHREKKKEKFKDLNGRKKRKKK